LMHNLKHNMVLHRRVVLLTVRVGDIPHVPESERIAVQPLASDFHRVFVHYGFKDDPDLPKALTLCAAHDLPIDPMQVSYFLGRETLLPRAHSEMPLWREKIFITMFRNAGSAASFFNIPPNRVVEMGTQVVL